MAAAVVAPPWSVWWAASIGGLVWVIGLMMISEILLAGSVVCRLVMQVQMNQCGANASITGCVGATWVCGDIYHNFLLGSVWERYLRICNFLLGLIGSTCNATGTEAKKAPRKLLLKYN
jgi:hypothetical protein